MIRAVCLPGIGRGFPTVYLTAEALHDRPSNFGEDHNRRFGPVGRRMGGMTLRIARDHRCIPFSEGSCRFTNFANARETFENGSRKSTQVPEQAGVFGRFSKDSA